MSYIFGFSAYTLVVMTTPVADAEYSRAAGLPSGDGSICTQESHPPLRERRGRSTHLNT
jgi:hypothetical protein